VSDAGIAALASAGTVATLLPATMLFLGKRDQAPARRLVEAGVPVALATDFNPGTSPTTNFPLVLTLGVSRLGLSATEAIVATTVNGAAALALAGRTGQISAAIPPMWRCGRSATSGSCRIGSGTGAAWPRGHVANLVTPVT